MKIEMDITDKEGKDIMKRLFVSYLMKKKVLLPKELVKIFEREADKYFQEYKKESEWQSMFKTKFVKGIDAFYLVLIIILALIAIFVLGNFAYMVWGI